jgi:hypothetical protein
MRAVQSLLAGEMTPGTVWADPFAGKHSPATIRNDADPARPAEYHMDGLEFLQILEAESVDGVLFDPPYSVEQALRKYVPRQNGTAGRTEYHARCKDEIRRVLRPGGKAICFGWDSNGVGKERGFELRRVLLIAHGAHHPDTIVTVEQKYAAQPSTSR